MVVVVVVVVGGAAGTDTSAFANSAAAFAAAAFSAAAFRFSSSILNLCRIRRRTDTRGEGV